MGTFSPTKGRNVIYRIRLLDKPPIDYGIFGASYRLFNGPEDTYYVSAYSLNYLIKQNTELEIIEELDPEALGITMEFVFESFLYDLPPDELKGEIYTLSLSRKEKSLPCIPIYCGRTTQEIPKTFMFDLPGGKRRYRWKWGKIGRRRKKIYFRDHFPKLISKITDPDTRFVVSLGGGGLRMFAHPTVLKMIEAMGCKNSIEEIWGCSGGAIAGLAYSLGAEHKIFEQEGFDLYNKKYAIRFSPTLFQVLKNIFFTRFLPGTLPSLKGFIDIQKFLQETLTRNTKSSESTIPFYAIAYNLNTKKTEVLSSVKGLPKYYEDFIRFCTPIDSVLASSAIPILFVPKTITMDRKTCVYIDGSFFEEVPLTSIYRKWRIDKSHNLTSKKRLFILAVNLFPSLSGWKVLGHLFDKYIPFLELLSFLTGLADLARRARIDDQLREINSSPDSSVIEINLPRLLKLNFLDPQIIPSVIDTAHHIFPKQLMQIEASLPNL